MGSASSWQRVPTHKIVRAVTAIRQEHANASLVVADATMGVPRLFCGLAEPVEHPDLIDGWVIYQVDLLDGRAAWVRASPEGLFLPDPQSPILLGEDGWGVAYDIVMKRKGL